MYAIMDQRFVRPGNRWKKFTSTNRSSDFGLKKKSSRIKYGEVYVKRVKNFETDNESFTIIHEKYAVKKKNIIITYISTVNKISASKLGSRLALFGGHELNFNNNNKIKLLLQYWVIRSPLLRNDLCLFINHLKGASVHNNFKAQDFEKYFYEVAGYLNKVYSAPLLEEILIRNYLKNQQYKKK